ncbi:MAG: DNA translocase FtsK 4TM domain-containing protein [Candidatus Neomarinimicrobiota bacterium]
MKDKRIEITGILLIAVSVFVLISLIGYNPYEEPNISPNVQIQNPMGILGIYLSHYLIKIGIGYAALLLPILGIIWGWWLIGKKKIRKLMRTTLFIFMTMVLLSVSLGIFRIINVNELGYSYLTAGLAGNLVARLLTDFLGLIGAAIIALAAWLILIRGYFSWNYYDAYNKMMGNRFGIWKKRRKAKREKEKHTKTLLSKIDERAKKEEEVQEKDLLQESIKTEAPEVQKPKQESFLSKFKVRDKPEKPIPVTISDDAITKDSTETEEESLPNEEEIEVGEVVHEKEVKLDDQVDRKAPRKEYQLPYTDLLLDSKIKDFSISKTELLERADFLTQSLATFGVEGKVVNVSPGPVITLFEVEPAEGVRVNRFVQLSDDLARVMEASRVRVIAPIPSKSSVGIEIPNLNPETVHFKSAVNSEKFSNSKSKLSLAIGKTTNGEIETLDLAAMPHLLIAGTTGSGKSVCLNIIICSILYRAKPDEVKFLIIDPKKVEMTLYKKLIGYHLLGTEDFDESIVTTTDNAILALRALEKEMDKRYDILADAVVRNISEYNKKMEKNSKPIMPYLVLIIDELADLMMLSAKDVETPIARLAQLSRSVGIHLVIATQRPSVDVITGVIKANFPARIAFQVATKIDSRTILDTMGAEKLIGRGDMLYLQPGSSQPIRLHGGFITIEEIDAIMKHVSAQPKSDELKLAGVREALNSDFTFDKGSADDLFNEAVGLVITHQQGSISLLQRRLKVGYARAARLIDQMEQAGIVGPFTGSKAREVLVDETYLQIIE